MVANVAKSEVIHNHCVHLCHRRLGHRDLNAIQRTYKESLATGMCINECMMMTCAALH